MTEQAGDIHRNAHLHVHPYLTLMCNSIDNNQDDPTTSKTIGLNVVHVQ